MGFTRHVQIGLLDSRQLPEVQESTNLEYHSKAKKNAENDEVYAVHTGIRLASKETGKFRASIDRSQEEFTEKGYFVYKNYSDVVLGLNDKRKGLLQLLKVASLSKFEGMVITYNDRLARFGLQTIKEYLKSWDVHLEVIHPNSVDNLPYADLIANLPATLYSFMSKLYRLRRKPKRKGIGIKTHIMEYS